jgi:hypothetical protein
VSAERVLAAAVALREFSNEEIASYCDEPPDAIDAILASAGGAVARSPADPGRWLVVEPSELRRMVAKPARRAALRNAPDDDVEDQLKYAERTLLRCGAERSGERRRVLVATAVNHLRQAVAGILRVDEPWWAVELGSDRVDRDLRRYADPVTATRLRLGVTVARLAVDHVSGTPVPSGMLIDTVSHLRSEAAEIGCDDRLDGLVRGFVDLATAQVAAPGPTVHQLVVAVARRRVALQAETDPVAAMAALEPLVRQLADPNGPTRWDGLYRALGRSSEGDHAVVYTDLLALLPCEVRYDRRGEPLPGGLVEVVGDHAAADRLRHCAVTLESDLRMGDIHSEAGLIGQAAQVFQLLADEVPDDDGIRSRGDATRTELNTLAMAPMWPVPSRGERA